MNNHEGKTHSTCLAIEVFLPKPNMLYNLDTAAHLAGVSRRSMLLYCRDEFIHAVNSSPDEVMEFTEEAIHTVRRIEQMRTVYGVDLPWIKILLDLSDEVEHLRAELNFLRTA
jgi:DNA-binding transcriptional MerR regulator